jgi:GAF domain-containing protein
MLTLSLTFLLANLFRLKQMVVLIGANLAVAVVFSLILLPQLRSQELVNTLGGITVIGLFVLLFAWHRDNVEQLRLTEILKTQTSLEKSNLELQIAQSKVNTRFAELRLSAEVGRSVSQVRALDVMLTDAAELIRKQFDLYYAQVYLVNPSQTALLLHSGTGTVGAELLNRGHQLPLNTASINGRAAIEKRSVVVADTTASAVFKPNPLLPNTRSEMAVPLTIDNRVVGVLNMQSETPNALNEETLPAYESLAGQLSVAIQNANLLQETNAARAEVEKQARRLTRANWVDYLDAIHKPEEIGFVFEQNKIAPLTQETEIKENALVAPIAVTGEALGNLVVEMEGQSPIARTEELVNAVAHQVAQQIESLRLLESAERYRYESEQASRRLTREGWKNYTDANADKGLSYIYDLKEVRTYHQIEDQQAEESAFSLPLKVRDETVGRLVVQDLKSDDSEALDLANAVAERLGAHIESLRLFDETRNSQVELDKRAQQLAAVAEISTVSSKELDIDKMLKSMVNLTQRKFGLYHAHVFTINENTAALDIQACGWKEGDEHEGLQHGSHASIPLEATQSLVARAVRTKQAVIVNDVRSEPDWLPNPSLPDTASEMAVPLIVGDQVLGVMDVQADRINAFTEEDANIQTTLASQIATSLQNARSFVRAQQQAERESTLNAISQKIQSATTVEAVLQIAARELGHALGAPRTVAQLSLKDKK